MKKSFKNNNKRNRLSKNLNLILLLNKKNNKILINIFLLLNLKEFFRKSILIVLKINIIVVGNILKVIENKQVESKNHNSIDKNLIPK